MYDCFACGCVYVHMCAIGGQKKALDFLELKLQTVVSHRVSSGNQIYFLHKSDRLSLSHPASPPPPPYS